MSEEYPDAGASAAGARPASAEGTAHSAGAVLRAAREAQGLHIAALAASIKVPPRKLEALEADRLDELHDLAFARALAQAVCRALKLDSREVLALLPSGDRPRLERMEGGLNAPFRERAMPASAGLDLTRWLRHPALGLAALLLMGAMAVWFWPAGGVGPLLGWLGASAPTSATSPAAEVAAGSAVDEAEKTAPAPGLASSPSSDDALPGEPEPALAASAVVETVHSAPESLLEAANSPPAAISPVVLVLRAREASWVEVADGQGQSLLSRTLVAGETVGIDGSLPLKLRIGNASATEVAFRGQAVDLSTSTRDNIARLELK